MLLRALLYDCYQMQCIELSAVHIDALTNINTCTLTRTVSLSNVIVSVAFVHSAPTTMLITLTLSGGIDQAHEHKLCTRIGNV